MFTIVSFCDECDFVQCAIGSVVLNGIVCTLLAIISAADHDKFFQQLEGSDDGFSVVADYFGRGIFLPPRTREE